MVVFKGEIAGRVHVRVAGERRTDPCFAWQGRARQGSSTAITAAQV